MDKYFYKVMRRDGFFFRYYWPCPPPSLFYECSLREQSFNTGGGKKCCQRCAKKLQPTPSSTKQTSPPPTRACTLSPWRSKKFNTPHPVILNDHSFITYITPFFSSRRNPPDGEISIYSEISLSFLTDSMDTFEHLPISSSPVLQFR